MEIMSSREPLEAEIEELEHNYRSYLTHPFNPEFAEQRMRRIKDIQREIVECRDDAHTNRLKGKIEGLKLFGEIIHDAYEHRMQVLEGRRRAQKNRTQDETGEEPRLPFGEPQEREENGRRNHPPRRTGQGKYAMSILQRGSRGPGARGAASIAKAGANTAEAEPEE